MHRPTYERAPEACVGRLRAGLVSDICWPIQNGVRVQLPFAARQLRGWRVLHASAASRAATPLRDAGAQCDCCATQNTRRARRRVNTGCGAPVLFRTLIRAPSHARPDARRDALFSSLASSRRVSSTLSVRYFIGTSLSDENLSVTTPGAKRHHAGCGDASAEARNYPLLLNRRLKLHPCLADLFFGVYARVCSLLGWF